MGLGGHARAPSAPLSGLVNNVAMTALTSRAGTALAGTGHHRLSPCRPPAGSATVNPCLGNVRPPLAPPASSNTSWRVRRQGDMGGRHSGWRAVLHSCGFDGTRCVQALRCTCSCLLQLKARPPHLRETEKAEHRHARQTRGQHTAQDNTRFCRSLPNGSKWIVSSTGKAGSACTTSTRIFLRRMAAAAYRSKRSRRGSFKKCLPGPGYPNGGTCIQPHSVWCATGLIGLHGKGRQGWYAVERQQ